MSLIIPANTLASGGYEVANSCRFNEGSSDELTRTFGTATSRKIFTLSFWIKRTNLSGYDSVFFGDTAGSNNADQNSFFFHENFYLQFGGWNNPFFTSTRLFRDVSAWSHIVVAVDTTQGTASNRIKLYVNGVQETYTSGSGFPDQNDDLGITKSGNHSWFGNDGQSGRGNGYLAEAVLIDGTAYAATDFGEFDENSGIWKPIDVSGLIFGNNGFYLDFENSGALGADVSGNTNNFTVNNLTAIDQSISTPTNIFATFNSAQPALANTSFSEGNLVATTNSSASTQVPFATTIPVSTGKWYAEFKMIAKSTSSGSIPYIGVLGAANFVSKLDNAYFVGGANLDGVGYGASGVVYSNSSELDSSEASFDDGDIISVAADITNRKIYFAKNGTYINSGNPASAANGYTIPTTSESFYIFSASLFGASGSWGANFGSPPYAISSGNTDGNGYGNFEYAVPSGYYALNTKNLSEFG